MRYPHNSGNIYKQRCSEGKGDCIFCHLALEGPNSRVIHLDSLVVAFDDINPASDTHILVIPRKHICDLTGLDDRALLLRMVEVGEALLIQRGVRYYHSKMGFHVPPFLSVQHLHLHCMSLPHKNLWRDVKYDERAPWFISARQAQEELREGAEIADQI